MSGSVQAAREALGMRLRELREDARLTQRDLSAAAGWHFTKTSKIEHGKTAPTVTDLETWCFHTRSESQLPDLIATARGIEKMYVELRRLMRAGAARYQRDFADQEATARRHRVFAMFLIPGVLQTREYAIVRFAEFAAMTETPADIAAAADARMRRTELILSGDRLFHFVLCEPVLTAAMAPPAVMLAQLRHLAAISRLPRIRLGVLPLATRHYSPLCDFWIRDDRTAETETYSAAVRVTQPSEIAMYAKAFDHYASVAVYNDAARGLIGTAISDLEQAQATS